MLAISYCKLRCHPLTAQRHPIDFFLTINYLHTFISSLSEKTVPLRELLRNDKHTLQLEGIPATSLKTDIS